jgi:transcription antitermination protein NusB
MFRRRRAREVALQVLCQRDANRAVNPAFAEQFVRERLREEPTRDYANKLIDGVTTRSEEIDKLLTAAAENWRLSRMAMVDRNVLRLGAFELLVNHPDAPPAVVLDEAIELARRFGSAESAAFVNGVLDQIRKLQGGA